MAILKSGITGILFWIP